MGHTEGLVRVPKAVAGSLQTRVMADVRWGWAAPTSQLGCHVGVGVVHVGADRAVP